MRYWAYEVLAYMADGPGGTTERSTAVHVVTEGPEPDEAGAIEKARRAAPGRNYYHVKTVVERDAVLEHPELFAQSLPLDGYTIVEARRLALNGGA